MANYSKWAMAEAQRMLKTADGDKARMGQLFINLNQSLADRRAANEAARVQARSAKAKDNRAEVAALKAFTGAPTPTPFPLAKFLREVGAMTGAIDSGHAVATAARGDDEVDFDHPTFFPANADGAANLFRTIPDCMGKERVKKALANVEKQLAKSANKGLVFARVVPRGQPHDDLEQLAWVPMPWKTANARPEKLADFGAPWILANSMGCCRKGMLHWPLQGIGQVLLVNSGQCVIAMWPMESVLTKGSTWDGADKFIFGLANARFQEWAHANIKTALCNEGSIVWIPYGWAAAMVAQSLTVTAIIQPIVTATMAMRCGSIRALAAAQRRFVAAQQAAQPNADMANFGKSMNTWFDGLVDAPAAMIRPMMLGGATDCSVPSIGRCRSS